MENNARLYIFSGLPASGKTTIARELAKKIGAVLVRIDSIENSLKESVLKIHPAEDAGYKIAYSVALDNLKNGLCVVADSVNPIHITREAWREVALSVGANYVEIEIICSDKEIHKSRLQKRAPDLPNQILPNWEDVIMRDYDKWVTPHITIDTAKNSISESISIIIKSANSNNSLS